MKFDFKDIEPIASEDVYYDLFLGGYLSPENLLNDEDQIKKVNEAIEIVDNYLRQAESAGLIEEI